MLKAIEEGAPPQFEAVLKLRAYAGIFLSLLYMHMFVGLIREIAKVGKAYRELWCECSNGSLMVHSARWELRWRRAISVVKFFTLYLMSS